MIFGFIGSGKMATALVQGVVRAGAIAREQIVVTDTYAASAQALASSTGVRMASSNEELARLADVLVLCVKPGDALAALRALDCTGKLVISIVAGLTIAALEEAAGAGARVVRVMPNTPALVNKGAAGFSLGHDATLEDAAVAERIFGSVGNAFQVKEALLDSVTGLSGSGPAYVFLMIEALADGGVLMGLPRESALKLAAQTVAGAAELVLQTGEHPAVLRDMVTSPGGTTIAGIEALEKNGARSALISAVRAATERAREIGRTS